MSAFKIVQNIETVAVSSSGVSTSNPIPLRSGYLKISSDQNVYVELSPTPTLSTSSLWIASGESIILKETVISQKVIGIQTGSTTTLYLPEGTYSDFSVGDYVQLTGVGYTSAVDTDFAEVLSVDTTIGDGGGYSRKIVIDFDTSAVNYPMSYNPGSQDFGPIPIGGGLFISPPAYVLGFGSEGNVDTTAEVRKVTKVGIMGDGQSANVHITEIQIAGG